MGNQGVYDLAGLTTWASVQVQTGGDPVALAPGQALSAELVEGISGAGQDEFRAAWTMAWQWGHQGRNTLAAMGRP
eukprot:4348239-Alexandrium_andersonii.AAC.1